MLYTRCSAPATCLMTQNLSLTFGKDWQRRFSNTLPLIHRYSSFRATTIRSHLSPSGPQTILLEHGFQSGYTSSIVTTLPMNSRPMLSCMRVPADQKRARTPWQWRSRCDNRAMNGFGLGAFMAPRLTLMGTKRTFPFAEMQVCSEDWIILR